MVRICAFPTCSNRMTPSSPHSFHRLPLKDGVTLRRWLDVLQLDVDTPVQSLRLADPRVCSEHFERQDYCQPRRRGARIPKHFFLKKSAVPRLDRPPVVKVEVRLTLLDRYPERELFSILPNHPSTFSPAECLFLLQHALE